nr:hypothetical protein [Tanacetum cinerariifolium]
YENYLCNLCENNSHDGYDCEYQFPFVHEQKLSYNQNYDDQIHTQQYPEIHFSSQETSNEVFQANHCIQNEESFDPSNEIAILNSNREKGEPSQEFDIHQLIEECSTKVSEKQKMEDTMLELVKICQEKEFLCIHDDDLIEKQQAERGNRNIQSLQNFRVVHMSPISFNTSQISSIYAIAPILSTKELEHLLSMGYEHLSITPEMESDEVIEYNAENLLPIPSKCEVTLEDKIECNMPIQDQSFSAFTTFLNPLFNNDDLDFSDDESLPDEDVPAEDFKIYLNPLFNEDEINYDKLDLHCFNVEYNFVESLLNRDTFIDSSSKFDFSGELAHVNPEILKSDFDFEEEIRLIENLLYDNSSPQPTEELNAEIADTIVESIPSLPVPVQDGDFQREEIDIVTETDDVLPLSVENDDDSINDSLLEEVDLFLSDNLIPPGIENIVDDPEEPPDAETKTGEEIPVVMNDKDEDVNYSPFIFVIFVKEFSLLFAESEDTIFDPGISD